LIADSRSSQILHSKYTLFHYPKSIFLNFISIMIAKQLLFALVVSTSFLGSATAKGTGNTGGNTGSNTGSNTGGNTAASSSSLTLDSNLVQTGSQQTGGNSAGETASATLVNISYHIFTY
jgi:hypothetical protein